MKRLGTGIGWQKRKRIRFRTACLLLLMVVLITAEAIPVSAEKAVLGTTVTNQYCLYDSAACEHDGKIYFVLGKDLWSVEKDGTNLTRSYTPKGYFQALTVLGDCIYALETPRYLDFQGRLVRMKMDGTDYKVYKGKKFDKLEFLCAVDDRLYYMKDYGIYVMNPDGTGRKLLVQNVNGVRLIDGKYIYYNPDMAYGAGTVDRIIRCDMNGKKAETVLSSEDEILDFFVHEGDYYYSIEKGYVWTVYKKNIKSGFVKKLFSVSASSENILSMLDQGRSGPLDKLHADGKYLYYVNKKGHIEKVNKSTGKSKAFKGSIWDIYGVFDDVILAAKPKNKTPDERRMIVILVDRRTWKELAELMEITYH